MSIDVIVHFLLPMSGKDLGPTAGHVSLCPLCIFHDQNFRLPINNQINWNSANISQ